MRPEAAFKIRLLRPENRALLADLRSKCIAELRGTGAPFVDAMPATKQMQ